MRTRTFNPARCALVFCGLALSVPLLGGCQSSADQKPDKAQLDALRPDPSKMPPEARKAMESSGRPAGR